MSAVLHFYLWPVRTRAPQLGGAFFDVSLFFVVHVSML